MKRSPKTKKRHCSKRKNWRCPNNGKMLLTSSAIYFPTDKNCFSFLNRQRLFNISSVTTSFFISSQTTVIIYLLTNRQSLISVFIQKMTIFHFSPENGCLFLDPRKLLFFSHILSQRFFFVPSQIKAVFIPPEPTAVFYF